ncbi:NFACT family protein [Chloroflexi bacterium TSY]|nr:NFACT family protein [Chloroflexi bacterium TSY]
MHFDALTLACVCHELNDLVVGGRVQQVVQVDELSIGLEIYTDRQRRYLLLDVQPQTPRVHLVSQKLRRGSETPSPLLLLLRKYARGAALESIEQPDPIERILRLSFDHPEHGVTTLVVELIGRASNLFLLTPEERILDCARRIRSKTPNQRTLLPGRSYTLPPVQDKISPLDDGKPDYYLRFNSVVTAEGSLRKALVAHIAGMSPSLAKETAWRAANDVDVPAREVAAFAVVEALQSLWGPLKTGNWKPGLLVEPDRIAGFAPYQANFIAEAVAGGAFEPTKFFYQALESFYAQRLTSSGLNRFTSDTALHQAVQSPRTGRNQAGDDQGVAEVDVYRVQRQRIQEMLQKAQQRIKRQLAGLAKDEPTPGEPEQLRMKAEWLLALSSQIEPKQQTLLVELDDGSLEIVLDQERAPVEQAERMFKRAARLERAAKIIPERRSALKSDLDFLEQLDADLALAENQPELATVEEEMERAGLLPRQQGKRQGKKPKSAGSGTRPLRYITPDGVAILVGRNARQNDTTTFKIASGDDLWLHVRNSPGSHVVIRSAGQTISNETILMAAQLAAYYSKQRGERAVSVSITPRRFVTRVPGGRPGQVYIRNEETRTVTAELPKDVMLSER